MNDKSQMMMNFNNLNQPQMMMNQQPKPQMKQSQIMMNQTQPQIINRGGYNNFWYQQHQQQPHMDPNMKFKSPMQPNFAKPGRINNWKGKKGTDKRKDTRRIVDKPNQSNSLTVPVPINNNNTVVGGGGYQPPTLYELQSQNRLKARNFYPKKRFNNRFAPYAPRNTTSFIIRAKKSGGIASLVSPCPVTPAVLPTPILSPSREVLGDMVKEEWGVDGYGSMKGLIRLRSPGHDEEEEEDGDGGGSSESDVEEHVEVERRLDHDLSRFEMIYPNYGGDYNNGLENRVDDQDSHITQLEEENLTLKERLFLMERELGDLRRRLLFLERQNQVVEDVNEEVVENGSDNESEGGSDVAVTGIENNVEMVHSRPENGENGNFEVNARVENDGVSDAEGVVDVCMEESVPDETVAKKNEINDNETKDKFVDRNDESKAHEGTNECVNDIVFNEKDEVVRTSSKTVGDDGDSSILR
ncbi:unnamed protein product [Lupinus luteus]|uniref:PRLI-interacting factor A n=1 Tax=Lupinus luteus TaxID=3873 RepID=A0AAV1X4H1_LUPLU